MFGEPDVGVVATGQCHAPFQKPEANEAEGLDGCFLLLRGAEQKQEVLRARQGCLGRERLRSQINQSGESEQRLEANRSESPESALGKMNQPGPAGEKRCREQLVEPITARVGSSGRGEAGSARGAGPVAARRSDVDGGMGP